MASFRCPNCGEFQDLPLEDFGPGFVGGPALFLGYLFGAFTNHKPDLSSGEIPILGLVIGISIGIIVFIWYLINYYVIKCENCGNLTRGLKKKD